MQNPRIQSCIFVVWHVLSQIFTLSNISSWLVSFTMLFTILISYSSYYCMASCFFCHSSPQHPSHRKQQQTVWQICPWATHMAATDNVLWFLSLTLAQILNGTQRLVFTDSLPPMSTFILLGVCIWPVWQLSNMPGNKASWDVTYNCTRSNMKLIWQLNQTLDTT